MSRAWYAYNGTGSPTLPENYIRIVIGGCLCLFGRKICCIYAVIQIGSTQPATISPNLQNYIAVGMATGIPQPSSPVGAKKYVYLIPN